MVPAHSSHRPLLCSAFLLVLLLPACLCAQPRLLSEEHSHPEHYEADLQEISELSEGERQRRSVYAVAAGFPVTYSTFSVFPDVHIYYRLDFNEMVPNCWAPARGSGQWIQVSAELPKIWTAVIIQGRGDLEQWVTGAQISYTLNGRTWDYVDGGRVFPANTDRHTQVVIAFAAPVYARAIRINPITWHNWPSLRFDAVLTD